MELAASIALAAAGLALSLIIQKHILLATPEGLKSLARQVEKLAIRIALPIGIIFVVIGSIWFNYVASFTVVGVIFIILAIILLVQSRVLSSPPGDPSLKRFGKLIGIYAYVLAAAALIAIVIIVIRLIIMFL